ncbi:hypothetical protein JCM11491_006982 [Sporobolomyces phaffii]
MSLASSPPSPPAAPSPPLESLNPAKRSAATATANAKPAKKARASVGADETTQVSSLAHHRLPFADADVSYVDDFIDKDLAQKWHDELIAVEGWYQPTLKMYGKEITQSRKIAAFATDTELTVKYSGALVDMQHEYPPLLRKIQDMIEAKLGVKFNHCMMNRYENGSVYIGNHRDNRENRVIASLSLGAPRTFIMEHDKPPSDAPASSKKPIRAKAKAASKQKADDQTVKPDPLPAAERDDDDREQLYYKKWILENGSLVVMQGETQAKWKHQIPKELKVKESRISLTFRQLVF